MAAQHPENVETTDIDSYVMQLHLTTCVVSISECITLSTPSHSSTEGQWRCKTTQAARLQHVKLLTACKPVTGRYNLDNNTRTAKYTMCELQNIYAYVYSQGLPAAQA